MYPGVFEYCAPDTLEEALTILDESDDAKILSGGQSLVPLLKLRLVLPELVVDINRLSGLSYVSEDDAAVAIGALVRHHDVLSDPILSRHFPFLRDVVELIGDRQVRSRGTIAGTLVEADPSGDWSSVLLTLNADVVVISRSGERIVPLRDFFEYAYTPALHDNEIVREIRIPKRSNGFGAYEKLEKRHGDFAIAACSVFADRMSDGSWTSTQVGFSGIGATPILIESVSSYLDGKVWSDAVLSTAAATITEAIDPLTDSRGTADYKRAMAGVVFRRAVENVINRTPSQ